MVQQVRPSQLADWLAGHGGTATLLDVREPWERAVAQATAPGLRVVAMPMHRVPSRLAELDASQPVACLCHHGARSQQVALYLERHGFDTVANVAGGIDAWSRELDGAVPRY